MHSFPVNSQFHILVEPSHLCPITGLCSLMRVVLSLHLSSHPLWRQDNYSSIRVVLPSWWQGICFPIRVVSSASCGCLLLSPLWYPSSMMAVYLLPHVGCPRYPAGTSFHSPISPTAFGETATERNKNIEVMCRRRS